MGDVIMGDESDGRYLDAPSLEYLEYSDETPFVRAALEEHIKKKEEEEEEENEMGEAAKKNRIYELDEKSVSFGWRIFALAIVAILNALNFTQQYIMIVTIFGMANELEFGETECQVINETLARDYLRDHNMTGDKELCADIGRCSENSTLSLPDVCQLYYTGQGLLYEILAGPSYLVVQGILGIPLVGLTQSFSFRPAFTIGLSAMLWTSCTFITAYVNDYWAIALLRFLFGVFSGPYIPVAYAYLASIFPKNVHTLVFGIAHFACMAGYGFSFFFIGVSDSIGWRWCYYITGAMGVFVAICSCLMANPKVLHHRGKSRMLRPSNWKQQRNGLRQINWPLMMSLILANTSRLAALNVGSFNITIYITEYFPDFNLAIFGLISLAASFPGSIFGAFVGDLLRRTSGIRGRLWLCVALMIIASVVLPMVFQTPIMTAVGLGGVSFALSDCFYVVNLAIISDLTPLECKTVIFALNFFFTFSLGGAANLMVTPIASLIGLRLALSILCALFSGISVFILLVPLSGVIKVEFLKKILQTFKQEAEDDEIEADETTPLTVSYRSSHSIGKKKPHKNNI